MFRFTEWAWKWLWEIYLRGKSGCNRVLGFLFWPFVRRDYQIPPPNQSYTFWDLPAECQMHILQLLDTKALCEFSRVCKNCKKLAEDNRIWKAKFAVRWKVRGGDEVPCTWKQAYGTRMVAEERWKQGDFVVGHVLSGHQNPVYSLKYHGNILLSGCADGTIRKWRMDTGECVAVMNGHKGQISALHFNVHNKHTDNTDGIRLFAAASGDATVGLWDFQTGALLGKLVGHERWVKSVQLGVRDLFVISGGADRVARLWDVETRTLVRTFEGHTNVVTGVSLSGDNRELYTASAAGTIHIFDLASDKCVATLNGPVLGLLSDMLASSHPDNSNNSTLPPTPASVMCMDVDYTNRRIFAGLGNHVIDEWDLRTLSVCRTFGGHRERIYCVQHDESFDKLLSVSYDGVIKLWDVSTNDSYDNRSNTKNRTGNSSHTCGRFDNPPTASVCTLKYPNIVYCAQFDQKKLVTGSLDACIQIWDFAN